MKKLSKMMLAAVASVALAAPAFAWDFSASGSTTATWNQTTNKANSLAATKEETKVRVHGEGGSLALKSSHTDGAKTASVTYSLDWDNNLDESLTVAGSNKVGKWTASGSVSYDIQRAGCSATSDNTSVLAGPAGASTCPGDQTDNDMAAITLTDGTMTIVFGEAAHLSGQNVSSGSVAGGSITMDSADADASAGAMIDAYQGVSLGYAISDTMSVTVAMQSGGAGEDGFGTGEALDGETSTTHDVSGFGLGFSGTFGPATIGFTQVSSSTADFSGGTAAGLQSTSWSSMGLGVSIDLGDIDPFISYGTASGSAGSTANKVIEHTHSASEFGLTYALGTDTIVLYMGNSSDQYSNTATDNPTEKSGMELGYNTAIGPVSLGVGYGTQTKSHASNTAVDGYSNTDIEVNMGFSF
jgi:hypothetical protein